MMETAGNFDFLQEHDPVFCQIGAAAERAFPHAPNTTLIKLRQLAEAMAQDLAARAGIVFDDRTTQVDLLYKIQNQIHLDPLIKDVFHTLRIEGNKATHQFQTQHREAMDGLKLGRVLAVWFHLYPILCLFCSVWAGVRLRSKIDQSWSAVKHGDKTNRAEKGKNSCKNGLSHCSFEG